MISLIVPEQFSVSVPPLPFAFQPIIYVNRALQQFLDGFYFAFTSGVNRFIPASIGFDYSFNLSGLAGFKTTNSTIAYPYPNMAYPTALTDPTTYANYYIFSQEYQTIGLWTSLRKIIITSNSIPVQNEFVPSDSISSTLPIITDFVPNIQNPGDTKTIAYYFPQSQYRLVDLKSDLPLNTIDLKIFWQDKLNNTFPLLISSLQQGSIKLAFVKKSLYKPKNLLFK